MALSPVTSSLAATAVNITVNITQGKGIGLVKVLNGSTPLEDYSSGNTCLHSGSVVQVVPGSSITAAA